MKIRARTILVIIVTNFIIILFSVSAGMVYVRRNIDRYIETDMMAVADIADQFISKELELLKLKGDVIAHYLTMADEADWPAVLARQAPMHPQFVGMAILGRGGVTASVGEWPARPELADNERVKRAFSGRKAFTSTIPYDSENGVMLYLAVPIPGEAGRVLALTIRGLYLSELVSEYHVWQTGHIFIDDSEGYVLANIRHQWVQERQNFIAMGRADPSYAALASMVGTLTSGSRGIEYYSIAGVPRVCAYRPISASEEGWCLGIVAPLSESPVKGAESGFLIIGLVGCVLSAAVAVFASQFLRKPYEQVAALKEAAEAQSRAKSRFLANMSHEIRTPMNAVLGITEIQLQDEALPPRVKEALKQIYSSGDMLLSIINDILDMSKIEAGKFELEIYRYETASLLNDTVALNMMRIGSKRINFTLSVDENIPSSMFGDELRIKQILNNVLSNAFKYTEKGEVKLSAFIEPRAVGEPGKAQGENLSESGSVTLVFVVSDTGQGMTDEQMSKLFDLYSRFNMDTNRVIQGTGLGMGITQNLLSMMGGGISVTSELGRGSTFTIRLPQKSAGPGVLGRDLADNLQKFQLNKKQLKKANVLFEPMPYGSILVVDDVESNLYVAKGLMSPYKLSIDTAASGFEAIDKIKGGKTYDIVFMDHMMPRMDGIEATQKLRALGYARPIVALTANALVGQSDIFLTNGFDDFISKPVDTRQLNAVLKKFVRDTRQIPADENEKNEGKNAPSDLSISSIHQFPSSINHSPSSINQPLRQPRQGVSPKLAELFARDAAKIIETLESIHEQRETRGAYEDEEIRLYTVSVHGIKSVLANVGEAELSAAAGRLEQAGRDKDTAVMSGETGAFIAELRAAAEKMKNIAQPEADEDSVSPADLENLRATLLIIKEACDSYDKKAAKNAITELRQKNWPPRTRALLASMSEHLLYGDFEEVSKLTATAIDERLE